MLEDDQVLVRFWKEGPSKGLQDFSKITRILIETLKTEIQDSDAVAQEL